MLHSTSMLPRMSQLTLRRPVVTHATDVFKVNPLYVKNNNMPVITSRFKFVTAKRKGRRKAEEKTRKEVEHLD